MSDIGLRKARSNRPSPASEHAGASESGHRSRATFTQNLCTSPSLIRDRLRSGSVPSRHARQQPRIAIAKVRRATTQSFNHQQTGSPARRATNAASQGQDDPVTTRSPGRRDWIAARARLRVQIHRQRPAAADPLVVDGELERARRPAANRRLARAPGEARETRRTIALRECRAGEARRPSWSIHSKSCRSSCSRSQSR